MVHWHCNFHTQRRQRNINNAVACYMLGVEATKTMMRRVQNKIAGCALLTMARSDVCSLPEGLTRQGACNRGLWLQVGTPAEGYH